MKEQVMIYSVSKSATGNAKKLFSQDGQYFYWNDYTYKKLSIGDYVFVIIKSKNQVLYTN